MNLHFISDPLKDLLICFVHIILHKHQVVILLHVSTLGADGLELGVSLLGCLGVAAPHCHSLESGGAVM